MAGGKQSPRQKMVNLMYLVFICMLALNMSKEVLAAFGLMNVKMETANARTTEDNSAFLASLGTKAEENAEKYAKDYENAQKVQKMSQEFYNYLEGLKKEMTKDIEDPTDYQVMDKADFLDQKFFKGDNLNAGGKEFLKRINDYRTQVSALVPERMKSTVATRFKTGDANGKVEKRDGTKQDWINYHYEGFPLIASLTKLTAIQSDIKTTEQDALKAMLEGNLSDQVSLKNFTTSLGGDKSVFYAGEKMSSFNSKIIVSKTDNTSTPVRAELTLDGRKLAENTDYKLEAGGITMLTTSGAAGDHKVEGEMFFMQDGEEIAVKVNSTFATITKPNAAVIAADKMNVVYRGVANPMTISIPGIPDNKVSASAPGLSKRSGSKYVMSPGTGRSVTINASGVLPDGQKINTPATFRIKDIPRPSGAVRGETGSIKMPRRNLEVSTVSATLEDFDFDLNLGISGFKFKVPGQPTVVVRGNKLNAAAKSALKRARRGDAVQLFGIQSYISNNKSYKLKKVSPVVVELTN